MKTTSIYVMRFIRKAWICQNSKAYNLHVLTDGGCARKYWEMLSDPTSRSPVLEHTLNHPTTNKFVAWSSEWKMCDLNFI